MTPPSSTQGAAFPQPAPPPTYREDASPPLADIEGPGAAVLEGTTLVLDWDRERYTGALPRRVPLPVDQSGPGWVALPHQRYVLCARHLRGRIEQVFITSLIGRRDSLIPAGGVDRVVTDDRSVTVVVEGRPFLYSVEAGTTLDITTRRLIGTAAPTV